MRIGLWRLAVEIDGVVVAVEQPAALHAAVGARNDDGGVPRLVGVTDCDRRPALSVEGQRVVCPKHQGRGFLGSPLSWSRPLLVFTAFWYRVMSVAVRPYFSGLVNTSLFTS